MCTDGGNFAFAENDDEVCPADLREAVRDDKSGPSAGGVGDCALDLILGGRVDGGGGIIQHENARVGEKGAGEGDALALSAGEGHAAFADDGSIRLVKLKDEVMRLCGGGCSDDLVFCRAGFAESDIVA